MKEKLKKVPLMFVGIFIGLVILFVLDIWLKMRIDNEIKDYMQENYKMQVTEEDSSKMQEIEENISNEKVPVDYKSTYEEIVDMLFPFDGYYYIPSGNGKFYSNISCKDEYLIENPRFLSRQCQSVIREEDGVLVYLYLLDNGNLCYSYSGNLGTFKRE